VTAPEAAALRYFVPCGRGLEYLLADELLALGAAKATAAQSGVNAEGDAESLLRVRCGRASAAVR